MQQSGSLKRLQLLWGQAPLLADLQCVDGHALQASICVVSSLASMARAECFDGPQVENHLFVAYTFSERSFARYVA